MNLDNSMLQFKSGNKMKIDANTHLNSNTKYEDFKVKKELIDTDSLDTNSHMKDTLVHVNTDNIKVENYLEESLDESENAHENTDTIEVDNYLEQSLDESENVQVNSDSIEVENYLEPTLDESATVHVNTDNINVENYLEQSIDESLMDPLNINKRIGGFIGQKINCVTCGKYLSDEFSLQTHIKIHHERAKTHKCDLCEKTFSLGKNLKIYSLIIFFGYKHFKEI